MYSQPVAGISPYPCGRTAYPRPPTSCKISFPTPGSVWLHMSSTCSLKGHQKPVKNRGPLDLSWLLQSSSSNISAAKKGIHGSTQGQGHHKSCVTDWNCNQMLSQYGRAAVTDTIIPHVLSIVVDNNRHTELHMHFRTKTMRKGDSKWRNDLTLRAPSRPSLTSNCHEGRPHQQVTVLQW